MINVRYRVKSPKFIDTDFIEENVNNYDLVIRPTFLSICKADQRYYQGLREKQILDSKLPLALIHEGIGKVVYSKVSEFKRGDSVVMIPNISNAGNGNIKENYQENSKFRGSSIDGFMQSNIFCNKDSVIKIESDKPYMVFAELMSVVFGALEYFKVNKIKDSSSIAVFGDGSLGYLTALILTQLYPNCRIIVAGKQKNKLDYFTFVSERYFSNKLPTDLHFKYAFECVGGDSCEKVIDSIINFIDPQGVISLLGVSEYPIAINTRKILEKGLTFVGNSRSNYQNFKEAISFIEHYPSVANKLNILISDLIEIKNLKAIDEAFLIDLTNDFKTVMKWDI